MKKHITTVGVLHIGFGALGILVAVGLFAAAVGLGLLVGDQEALHYLASLTGGLALFLIVLSVPDIVAGIGVLKLQPWARYLALVLAALDLFIFPVGTVAGIYTIWVLVQDETVELFGAQPRFPRTFPAPAQAAQ